MKKLTYLLLFLCSGLHLMAQTWTGTGTFNNANGPSTVWYDSTTDRLLVSGEFTWFDSSEIHGYGYLQGDSLISLGCGFRYDCGVHVPYQSNGTYILGFARFQGDLYATGWFDKAGGVEALGIAKWGVSDWEPVGGGLKFRNGYNGLGFGLKVMNGELYVYGSFDSINGIAAHNIARFDGNTWRSAFDFPDSIVAAIYAAEWFQNELYGNHPLNPI